MTFLVEAPRHDRVHDYRMLIGGRWVQARSGETLDSINPYNGEVWATAPRAASEDVDGAVGVARQALESGPWVHATGTERARLLRRLAELIEKNAEPLSLVESTDNGKLLREMSGQISSLPEWYYYFSGVADKIEGRTIPSNNSDFFVYTCREPVGVVAAIVPWNSPLLLLAWKLAPALAAGCTVVVKPAEQTPASTLEFAKLFEEAGFPPGVVSVVTGDGVAGSSLARHPDVDKVAFTGSTATGKSVMRDAAEHLAEVSLELGGKSPQLVFADADIEAVVNGVISGIFAATGQTCVAGSRLLVQNEVYDDLINALSERARTIKMGDPLAADTEMGPMAFAEQLEKVEGYVASARQEGATVACGGKRPEDDALRNGFFIEPTIIAGVSNDMTVARDEIFGPVLSVIRVPSEEEAMVRAANDTPYGLAAGVWTNDVRRAHRVAHSLRAGTVWVNSYRSLSFNTPFGGYKQSGIGRENGLESVDGYTQTKSVWIDIAGHTRDPFRLG